MDRDLKPATPEDVAHVATHMWGRGREELKYLSVSPKGWWEAWMRRIARGDAVSFGEAILGCDWESDDVVNTSFQATEAFEQGKGLQITKEMRRAIPRLMEERGIRIFNTYSLCIDPSAEKWFRLLGLTEDTNYTGAKFGPYVARRFFRRA